MSNTAFRGPIVGNQDAMAGCLEGAPLTALNISTWLEYYNDFGLVDSDYNTTTDWQTTQVGGSGTVTVHKAGGATTSGCGYLRLDTVTIGTGPKAQLDGGQSVSDSIITYEEADGVAGVSGPSIGIFTSRFRVTDRTATGCFVGLGEASNFLTTAGGDIINDTHIGFHVPISDAPLIFTASGRDDTLAVTTTTLANPVDSEWIEVAVRAEGTDRYSGYIRTGGGVWSKVASGVLPSNNTWNNNMIISFQAVGTNGGHLEVDYVYYATNRDRVLAGSAGA